MCLLGIVLTSSLVMHALLVEWMGSVRYPCIVNLLPYPLSWISRGPYTADIHVYVHISGAYKVPPLIT